MQYQIVTAANIHQQINQTDHKVCQTARLLVQDVGAFLQKNAACQCSIVQLNVNNAGKKNVLMIRGKLSVNLPEAQRQRPLGFKFVLPVNYPQNAPLVYLDEPENQQVVDMIDYLEPGNRIMFKYIYDWDKSGQQIVSGQEQQYCLLAMLGKVYNLFCKQPPISFEELFGNDDQHLNFNNPALQRENSINLVYKNAQQSEDMREDLDNFDPLAELDKNLANLNNEHMDANDRKSVWKMNYIQKNELSQKADKINIGEANLLPQIKEIVVDNMWQLRKGQINDLCEKVDRFEDSHIEINDELKQLKGHNDLLTDNMPAMDKQIEIMRQKLQEVESEDITADKLMDDIFKPQSAIDQKIMKYQCKEEAFQGTMLGFKMVAELDNLSEWLKNIRQVSNKQFSSVYKKNKLINYKYSLQHGAQQPMVPGQPQPNGMMYGGYQLPQFNQQAYQL